jgi:DNA-binding transcriptional ArsR family regulator
MKEEGKARVLESFAALSDPRGRECAHQLDALLLVAICAMTSGAESWVAVAEWGIVKLTWLRQFLPAARHRQ